MSNQKNRRNALIGAAFLMATSAIGPGFLTQTATFTQALAASFGFVILLSILLDIGAQLNIWRIVAVSEKQAQDIANQVLPGAGYFLAVLIVMGGLAFNNWQRRRRRLGSEPADRTVAGNRCRDQRRDCHRCVSV